VYLAGNPGDARSAYESAGVDEFVHVGVDVIATLRRAHETLGVTR
jgi:methylmalonyl-CoA mutase